MSRRDHRPLRDDERELWRTVSKAIKPLRKRPATKAERFGDVVAPEKQTRKAAAVVVMSPPPAPKTPPPLAPLGRREKAKVARGKVEIDARLDLHGHTQAEAHSELLAFLRTSIARNRRMVLVITGKSGVLRQQVPLWLALPDFREFIIGFETAAIRHGGEGALYLRLRRSR